MNTPPSCSRIPCSSRFAMGRGNDNRYNRTIRAGDWLPCDCGEADMGAAMILDSKQGKDGAKRMVLVVEDNEIVRAMVCNALKEDFDIIQAENGLEGLEQLERHHEELSIVLLDVYMPVCDGFEFLRRKKEDERYDTIPVVVITSSDSIEDELACLEAGATDFIVKPYDNNIMMNRVNNLIHLRESASLVNRLQWDQTIGQLHTKEYFYQVVEETFAAFPETEYDLICSDIENFKALADRYGEENCNTLLGELAERLINMLPCLVASGRIDGDTFAFLIGHQKPGWEKVLYSVTDGMQFSNVNVKFGIVERVDRAMTVTKVCNRAISALDTLRGRHGIEVALFDDEMHQHQMLEQTIRESMEEALEQLQFSVFYQPKHDVRTNSIGGAEALARWFHPEIGFVSPGLFIPIFERNGFITKLDRYVWEEACREIRRCQDLGLKVVPISVNASRIDFDEPDLPTVIAAIADRHGVDHALLHVELTETAYSDNPEAVTETLRELKRLGFYTELDDFGAGYSSLVSLNTLPLDVMKLDMSMVRKATELNDFRIVESTIKLAQTLGLKTVVEGVETAEEARKVTEMGCDLIQGFYYSKPLNREEFERYLAES